MGMVNHSQSSRNSTFTMLLQYLEKTVGDKVDFLHANKHQNFPTSLFQHFWHQSFTLSLLMGMTKLSQSNQSDKFLQSLQYLKKKLAIKLFNKNMLHKILHM